MDGYFDGKELVILLFECIVVNCFMFCDVFSFSHGVYVGTLNLIASIPGPYFLTFKWHAYTARVY